MILEGCQIYLIHFNFHLQKSLENFDKDSGDKIWYKEDKDIKVSPLMPIRVKAFYGLFWESRPARKESIVPKLS